MEKTTFVAFCSAGLEGAISLELKKFGFKVLDSHSGRVFFEAHLGDIPFLNLYLKSTDRILIQLIHQKLHTFDELFDSVKNSKEILRTIIEKDAKITIEKVKITNSKLSAKGAVASVVKKAIIDALGGTNENGNEYKFIVVLKDNLFLLLLDTTGEKGLHKRGYRLLYSKAPLRETIASSVILLSRWSAEIPLFDPFCGSGTILIEAGTLDFPNINRNFSSENWFWLKNIWLEEKKRAMVKKKNLKLFGSDIDCANIKIAQENAKRAGVNIKFECKDFEKLQTYNEECYVISNLPYGIRLQENDILSKLPKLHSIFPKGKFYLLHPSEQLEKYFGRKADKKIRFQNSGIWTWLYMFYKV